MSGAAAAKVLLQIEVASLKGKGEEVDETKQKDSTIKLNQDTTDKFHHTILPPEFGLMQL